MKAMRLAFVAYLALGLWGCVAAGGLEEYKDEQGVTRVRTAPVSPVNTVANLVGSLGPWGILAAAGLRLGSKVIAHREILAHGQKDDDYDGIPDDQQVPPKPAVEVKPTATT